MRADTFQHHTPTHEQLPRIAAVRETFTTLEAALREHTAPNRERNLAFTNLEQAAMWAIKGIVLENHPETR